LAVLVPGRRIDIIHTGHEDYPISVTVIGDKPKVLPAAARIVAGELVPWRRERLVQFYSDLGRRTCMVSELRLR